MQPSPNTVRWLLKLIVAMIAMSLFYGSPQYRVLDGPNLVPVVAQERRVWLISFQARFWHLASAAAATLQTALCSAQLNERRIQMRSYSEALAALMAASAMAHLVKESVGYLFRKRRLPVRVKHAVFATYLALLAIPVIYYVNQTGAFLT